MSRLGNSLESARPDLAAQWHPILNGSLTPPEVPPGSSKKRWWLGECGHEWEATVCSRTYNNSGCPFCSTRPTILPGFNDLETRNPEVAKDWHPTKNDCPASQVLPGARKRAWWLCYTCGREWEASVKDRAGSKGAGCPSCRGRLRGLATNGPVTDEQLIREWHPGNGQPISDFSPKSNFKAKWVCDRGHEWEATIHDRTQRGTKCKQCGSGGTSDAEKELRRFVQSLGVQVTAHVRSVAPRFEYDIAVPDKKMLVEYNGLYWHAEDKKPGGRLYHARKTEAAERAGHRLLHIWEDDWRDRRSVVEKMIARKLGVSQEERYNARSLRMEEVSGSAARSFLEENHIQGPVPGSLRLGLFAGSRLVALMLFRSRKAGTWELARYATDGIVRGGFTRLIRNFIRAVDPEEIVSFSDRGVSDGGLYERSGFTRDGEIPPDYMYVVRGRREHKFNYRKKRFRNDPELKYEEGMTERELAELNRLPRIYDAGKTRWVWTRPLVE